MNSLSEVLFPKKISRKAKHLLKYNGTNAIISHSSDTQLGLGFSVRDGTRVVDRDVQVKGRLASAEIQNDGFKSSMQKRLGV